MMNIVIQIIGVIGYSLLAMSYFYKNKKDILFMQIVAYIFFVVHYYMLSGITGAYCNLIGLIAFVLIYLIDNRDIKYKRYIKLGIVPVVVILSLFTFSDIFSIFPIVAVGAVMLSFSFDNEHFIRFVGGLAALCWLIYAIYCGSWAAIVFEVITLIMIACSIVKNLKTNNKLIK